MTIPNGPDSDAAQMIQSLRDNAARYGLTWENAMATVQDGSDPGSVSVVFDGDDSVITVGLISTVGFLAQGERVYVLQIPPAGNYIYGRATGDFRDRQHLTGTQAVVTFSNIPANLRSLTFKIKARVTGAVNAAGLAFLVNGDGSALYSYQFGRANNATAAAVSASAATSGVAGLATGSVASPSFWGSSWGTFEGWDRTDQALSWDYAGTAIGINLANFIHDNGGGIYNSLKARTSLTFFTAAGSFTAGSDFQLLGEAS